LSEQRLKAAMAAPAPRANAARTLLRMAMAHAWATWVGAWALERVAGNGTQAATVLPLLQRGARQRDASEIRGNATAAMVFAQSGGAAVPLNAFFWNVHWQCGRAAGACQDSAHARLAALSQGADLVAAVELRVQLMPGWAQAQGSCVAGNNADFVALAVSPAWHVGATGGGCLRGDGDTRAFAVARVTPPEPVQECPSLCVIAIHAPHTAITQGRGIVDSVCGAAAQNCVVAIGDWNAPVGALGGLWGALVGGAPPAVAFPDERTCCWPATRFAYDHLVTNVAGAGQAGYTVHDYQVTGSSPAEEHRPVLAHLALPAAASR